MRGFSGVRNVVTSMGSLVLLVLALVACNNDVPDVPRAEPGVAPAVTALAPMTLHMLGPNGPEQSNATLAVSRRGHIAFTTGFDSAGRLVTLVDSTGRVLARVGTKGAGPGEFRMIIRLFVNDSTLYVYDGYHLSEFDLDGQHRRTRSVPPDVMLWHLRGDSIDARIIVDLREAMGLRRLSLRTLKGRELLSAASPVLRNLTRSRTDSTRYLPYSYAPKGAGFVLGNGSSHRMVAFDVDGVPLEPPPAFFGRDLPAQRLSGAALEREVERLLAAARRPFRLPDGTERINPVSRERMEKQAAAAIPYFSWLRGGLQSDQWGRTLAITPRGDSVVVETFDDYASKGRVSVPCSGRDVTAAAEGPFLALLCGASPDSDVEVELRLYRLGSPP